MNSIKKRLPLIIILFAIVLLSVGAFFVVRSVVTTSAQEVFSMDDGVECTENVKMSDSFLGGKTGYKFSTSVPGKGFRLKSGLAGDFNVSFVPVAEVNGIADYSELTFKFSSDQARLGFSLKFMATDNGVNMRLLLSNGLSRYKDYAVGGSFANLSDEPISFYFDPVNMVVSDADKNAIINLKDASFLAGFYSVTLFESFSLYDVDVTFSGIVEGKKASVIIFDMCGQSFSGSPISDTAAPVLFAPPTLNGGVVGRAYTISKDVQTYDVIDGLKNEFSGEISVLNYRNEPVAVTDYTFTPNTAGVYYVNYTPIDASNNKGKTVTVSFDVLSAKPDLQLQYDYLVENRTVGVNAKIDFPSVVGNSTLTKDKIPVKAIISLNGNAVFTNENCAKGFSHTFEAVGDYIVRFEATDVINEVYANEFTIKVIENAPVYTFFISDEYAKDKILDLNSAFATIGGNTVGVTVNTLYPSGKAQDSKIIILDEIGAYKTEFKAAGSDISFVRYYNVRNNNASLWEDDVALGVKSNVTAPSYADADYNGTMLTVSRPVEAVFKNAVDLSDNTKDDLLCEFFVAPTVAGARETSCIDIILTDAYDSSKVVDIRLTLGVWSGYGENITMSAMALTQRDYAIDTLYEVNKSGYSNTQGYYYYNTRVYSSFYGKISNANEDYPAQSVKLYFDYDEGVIYADNSVKAPGYGGTGLFGKNIVADLKDEGYVGPGNGWKKFTTGEAKFSVKISGISQEAHLLMLNVDGQSMSGEYTEDTNAPSIFLDYVGNSEDKIPNGLVNVPYAIFKPYSLDIVDGYSQNVTYSVYKKVGDILEEIEFNNDNFLPKTAGDYVIRYVTTDSFGLTTIKDVVVKVINESEYKPLAYSFSSKNENAVYVGQDYQFYAGESTGGTGKISTKVSVTLGGQPVEMDGDGVFMIKSPGTYVISTVLKDYVKQSNPFTFTINASYSPEPILELRTMPKLLLTGVEFTFPQFTAKRFSAANPEGIDEQVKYFVNDVENPQGKFTPTEAGDVKLSVQAGNVRKDYIVHVNQSVEGNKNADPNKYTAQFLYANGGSMALTETSAALTFNAPCEINVARLLDVNFIDFKVSGIKGSNLSQFDCVVTDSQNPNISVTITVRNKNANGDAEILFNGNVYAINGSFNNSSMSFKLGIDSEGYIIADSKKLAKIDKTDEGRTFEGFTSGKVYLDFSFNQVLGECVMGIEEISGQLFSNSIKMDRAGPMIKVLGDFEEIEVGEEIVIPAAVAYDFISGCGAVTLTVKSPSGEVLRDKTDISKPDSITASMIGTYVVEYYTTDAKNNPNSRKYLVTVMDKVPPVITIAKDVPTEGSLGKEIKLPKMTVTDDNTPAEEILSYIYYIAPSGNTVRVKDNKFVAEEKGKYFVIYFAQDAHHSTTIQRYVIEVS